MVDTIMPYEACSRLHLLVYAHLIFSFRVLKSMVIIQLHMILNYSAQNTRKKHKISTKKYMDKDNWIFNFYSINCFTSDGTHNLRVSRGWYSISGKLLVHVCKFSILFLKSITKVLILLLYFLLLQLLVTKKVNFPTCILTLNAIKWPRIYCVW